jgi:hypothetical protein
MEQVQVYSMEGKKIDLTTLELYPGKVTETQKDQLNENVMADHGKSLVVADMDGRVVHLGSAVSAKFVVERLGWHVEGYVAEKARPSKTDEAKKAMPEVVSRSVEAEKEDKTEMTSTDGNRVEKITPVKAREMAAATVSAAVETDAPKKETDEVSEKVEEEVEEKAEEVPEDKSKTKKTKKNKKS